MSSISEETSSEEVEGPLQQARALKALLKERIETFNAARYRAEPTRNPDVPSRDSDIYAEKSVSEARLLADTIDEARSNVVAAGSEVISHARRSIRIADELRCDLPGEVAMHNAKDSVREEIFAGTCPEPVGDGETVDEAVARIAVARVQMDVDAKQERLSEVENLIAELEQLETRLRDAADQYRSLTGIETTQDVPS